MRKKVVFPNEHLWLLKIVFDPSRLAGEGTLAVKPLAKFA